MESDKTNIIVIDMCPKFSGMFIIRSIPPPLTQLDVSVDTARIRITQTHNVCCSQISHTTHSSAIAAAECCSIWVLLHFDLHIYSRNSHSPW